MQSTPSSGTKADAKRDHDQNRRSLRGRVGVAALLLAVWLASTALPHVDAAAELTRLQHDSDDINGAAAHLFPNYPVYRIPLRVHLKESNRSSEEFKAIFEEINEIWLSQAGICFEMQEYPEDDPAEHGLDVWFRPVLHGGPDMNGYYRSDHDIQVRDTPILQPAAHPARHPAARTAAHEFGHGLSLIHRQDSDDNLMRSKTFGRQLNAREVSEARRTAADKALPDTAPKRCGEPRLLPALGRAAQ